VNKKQALRAQGKIIEDQEARIAELERVNKLYAADVNDYYACIEGTVDGKSICDWCEDLDECQLQAKGGKGCTEWMLRSQPTEGGDANDSEGVISEGQMGGERAENAECQSGTLS